MPRNSSGTYTLPIGAFSPGGLIKSADHNSNYGDIATALTQSLATTGVSTMTGQLKAATGTAAAPGYAFSTDLTSGMYSIGTGQLGLTSNGAVALSYDTAQNATFPNKVIIGGSSLTAGLAIFGSVNFGGIPGNTPILTFGGSTTFIWNGSSANSFWANIASNSDFQVVFDGGGAVIVNGTTVYLHVPTSFTINSWTVIADQTGSITFDILRANNAVPSSSIVGGGNAPALSSQQNAAANVSGWTSVALVSNDIIGFKVNGAPTNVTRVTVALRCTRTGNV